MKINEKIYTLRKEHNLSQEELANKLNVSRQTVSKWELGESCPDFDKIIPLCEIFGISTEELLRDKKIEKEEKNKGEKVDIVKAILICVSIFFYFLAIISIIVLEEIVHLNDGITVSAFLMLSAIGTVILIFTLLTRKNKEVHDEIVEKQEKMDPVLRSTISIISLIATCIYLLVSFLTMAWHITWIIWIIYSVVVEIVKIIYQLKKGSNDNE